MDPEAVAVNGSGTNGNGHHDPSGFGPTVELVPIKGHAPVPVNGNGANGHRELPEESQRSLFSSAEFMDEEPTRPKGSRGKPQPGSMSIFEWAFEQEREREAELACAGS